MFSTGALIGIIFGSVAIFAGIVGLIGFLIWRHISDDENSRRIKKAADPEFKAIKANGERTARMEEVNARTAKLKFDAIDYQKQFGKPHCILDTTERERVDCRSKSFNENLERAGKMYVDGEISRSEFDRRTDSALSKFKAEIVMR
jgi:hypothetical protein